MNKNFSPKSDSASGEPPASKGDVSREKILLTAAKLATAKGLDGLSIGELAAEVGMSKSGLYAHFKSKEELQLATIETAAAIFTREVVRPALPAPAGTRRLRALADSFLAYLKRSVFPGGCFFAAVGMELDTRPGLPRDRVVEVQQKWLSLLQQSLLDAQSHDEIDPGADVAQAVFEIHAMLLAANFFYAMSNDPTRLTQARQGIDNVLARLALRAGPKRKRPVSAKAKSR